MKRWWPSIRAALIAVAILLGLADGYPSPEPAQRKQMSATMRSLDDTIEHARRVILKPFQPFSDLVRAHQKWNLFAGASKDRYRMWIEARAADGEWQPLYKVFDDQYDFMAEQMAYRRMRGAWAPRGSRGPRGAYGAFCSWVAREVFARWPAYSEVRVSMEKVKVGPRGSATFTGDMTYVQKRTRAGLEAEEKKATQTAAPESGRDGED